MFSQDHLITIPIAKGSWLQFRNFTFAQDRSDCETSALTTTVSSQSTVIFDCLKQKK